MVRQKICGSEGFLLFSDAALHGYAGCFLDALSPHHMKGSFYHILQIILSTCQTEGAQFSILAAQFSGW